MRYVALLRAVNVGAHNRIAMTDLRRLLEDLGYSDVATLLQSGNAVLTSTKRSPDVIAAAIETQIATELGLDIKVLVRSRSALDAVIAGNPFGHSISDPKNLQVAFTSATPAKASLMDIDRDALAPEDFVVGDRMIYLHYANGQAASKMAKVLTERRLGVVATNRNWNTVTGLAALAAT